MNISNRLKFTYATGGLGKNIAYGLVASYTLYYYNTVLGISATFVGVLLMVARIFDAINDPLMGVVVAKTKSRFGPYKPWILSGALLNALVLVAMFNVPEVLSMGSMKLYVSITYFLCGITYTLSDIPYWSIVPAITGPGKEREGLTVVARTFSGIGAALPTVVTMALVAVLGGGMTVTNYRLGFSRLAIIVAVFYAFATVVTVANLPKYAGAQAKALPVKDLINALIKNDQAMSLAVILVLYNSATYLTTNLVLYVFQYDIGDEAIYSLFMAISGMVQFGAMVVAYPLLRRRWSNRQVFMLGGSMGLLGYAVLASMVAVKSMTMYHLLVPGCFISFANGIGYVLATVFVADAVDYGEAKTGNRQESMISSLQTLMVKLSSAVAVLVAGIGIDLVGLDTSLASQAFATKVGLRFLFAVPPLVLMAVAMFVFIKKKSIGREISG